MRRLEEQDAGAQYYKQQELLPDNQRARRTACFHHGTFAVPLVLALYIGLYCVDVFVVVSMNIYNGSQVLAVHYDEMSKMFDCHPCAVASNLDMMCIHILIRDT